MIIQLNNKLKWQKGNKQMKTRQLLKTDLPKKRRSVKSLHIPVLYNEKRVHICDIHFGNNEFCYLENCNGIPTKIENLQLILDGRNTYDLKKEISRKEIKQKEFLAQISKLQSEIEILKMEIQKS